MGPKKIIIIDNFIRGSRENMKSFINNPIIELHEADIRDTEALEKCGAGVDYVFRIETADKQHKSPFLIEL